MRKEGPMFLSIIAACVLIFSRYFHVGQAAGWERSWDEWFLISTAFGMAVGMINVILLQVKKIQNRQRNWWASIVTLTVMFPYLALIVYQDVPGTQVQWLMDAVTRPVVNTVFAMLAFFIFSAAYRAFRIKTMESTVLLLAAAVGMFGIAPIGAAVLPAIETWREWIFETVVTGAYRGITVGAYLGAMAIACRIILGLERSHLSAGGK